MVRKKVKQTLHKTNFLHLCVLCCSVPSGYNVLPRGMGQSLEQDCQTPSTVKGWSVLILFFACCHFGIVGSFFGSYNSVFLFPFELANR